MEHHFVSIIIICYCHNLTKHVLQISSIPEIKKQLSIIDLYDCWL